MIRRSLTRRGALAVAGTTFAALAGCSALSTGSEYDQRQLREIGERPVPDSSYSYPFTVPTSMIDFHRERTVALLEQVPESVSLPNAATASEIENDRTALSDHVETATGEDGGQDDGSESENVENDDGQAPPYRRLFEWRQNRVEAASLLGRYRAATGEINRAALRQRRVAIRSARSDFVAAHEYRGSDPERAVYRHQSLEGVLRNVGRELEPYPPFPDEPTDDPDTVGSLVEKVVRAKALLTDVRRFREQLPAEGTSYRPAMMATATWLRRRTRLTETKLERYLENGSDAFERDISGTTADVWFGVARDSARDHSNSDLVGAIGESSYATAVIEAGLRRTALSTLETVVDGIESGRFDETPSADELGSLRETAVEAVQSILDGDSRFEHRFVESGISCIRDGSERLEAGTSSESVNRAAGRFAYAGSLAGQATTVTEEVKYLLTTAVE